MATAEHPITRSELREELQHYATKADLAKLETSLVKWIIGMMVASIAVASSVALFVQRLWG